MKPMKYAQLTKQSGKAGTNIGKNPLRGNNIDGYYEEPPQAGKTFVFYSRPLTAGATIRVIETSPVKSVIIPASGDTLCLFETENSHYSLTAIARPSWLQPVGVEGVVA